MAADDQGMDQTQGRVSVLHDRTLLAVAVLTLVNTAGFVVAEVTDATFPPALTWVLTPIIIGLTARLSLRVKPDPGASTMVRHFWPAVAIGLMAFCLITTLRFVDAIGVVGVSLVPIADVSHAVGAVVMTTLVFLLPLDHRTKGRGTAHWLDVGTLMVAAGILLYHFASPAATSRLSLLAVLGAGLAGVYVAAKVALAGVQWMSRRAMYSLGAAVIIGGTGSAVSLLLPVSLNLNPLALLLPLAALAAALSAHFQAVDTAATARPRLAPTA